MAADQYANGSVPHVVPDVLPVKPGGRPPAGAAGWADAAVIIPWTMYLSYGDKRILEQQYDSMAKWVEYEKEAGGRRPHLGRRLPLRRLARLCGAAG